MKKKCTANKSYTFLLKYLHLKKKIIKKEVLMMIVESVAYVESFLAAEWSEINLKGHNHFVPNEG